MNAEVLITELAATARKAARTLFTASGADRKAALRAIADLIESRSAEILAANEKDMVAARAENMHPQMQDRLLLTPERITAIASGARQVAVGAPWVRCVVVQGQRLGRWWRRRLPSQSARAGSGERQRRRQR